MRPGIALLANGDVAAERLVPMEGSRRSSALIAEVDAACHIAGITPQQIELVAVSLGPGSFTGLRIGVTFAKTLAFAVGCRIVGVNTLHAIAESSDPVTCQAAQSIHVVADAQRGEVFYQPFIRTADPEQMSSDQWSPVWRPASAREIINANALPARLPDASCLVGPAVNRYRDEWASTGKDFVLDHCECRAMHIARLGMTLFATQQHSAWSLLPDYGRLSSAEEKRGDVDRH